MVVETSSGKRLVGPRYMSKEQSFDGTFMRLCLGIAGTKSDVGMTWVFQVDGR